MADNAIAIIGAALDLGAGRRGVDMGPSAIRYAGLEERLASLGCDCADWGNVATPVAEATASGDPRARFLAEIRSTCEGVAQRVGEAVGQGRLPIVLGGDHSIALGTLGGAGGAGGGAGWRRRPAGRARRCGSTPTAPSTRRRRRPAATCTGCRWPPPSGT